MALAQGGAYDPYFKHFYVFLIFPFRSLMSCCFQQNATPSNVDFDDAKKEFLTDYER